MAGAVKHVVVLGGGISGLTAAFALRRRLPKLRITLYEASQRCGGWLNSKRVGAGIAPSNGNLALDGPRNTLGVSGPGMLFEAGCRGIRPTGSGTKALELIEALGLQDQALLSCPVAKSRFVWYKAFMHVRAFHYHKIQSQPYWVNLLLQLLPSSLVGMILSPLTRPAVIAAIQRDILTVAHPSCDVSVQEFVSRHFGDHAARVLADAVMSGIYAGNIEKLSAEATLNPFWQLERKHGSLIRGGLVKLLREQKVNKSVFMARAQKASSISFPNGMSTLVDALRSALSESGVCIITSASVNELQCRNGTMSLRVAVQNSKEEQMESVLDADYVISALPAATLRTIAGSNNDLAESLSGISKYAGVAMACVGFNRSGIVGRVVQQHVERTTHPLLKLLPSSTKSSGFGFLVPSQFRRESSSNPNLLMGLLGMVWDSAVFPGQSGGREETRLSLMFGGDVHPDLVNESDTHLKLRALSALACLGFPLDYTVLEIFRAPDAIPQYEVGHADRVAKVSAAAKAAFGGRLFLTGNGYFGVGVADCISRSFAVADEVAAVCQ